MNEHLREEEVIPYLDACLSEAERRRLDTHLAACAACRAQLEELRAVLGVLEEWKVAEASPGFDAALRARLSAELRKPQPWYALRPAYAVALAAAVLTAIGVGLWRSAPSPTPAPPPVARIGQPPAVPAPSPRVQKPRPPAAADDLAVLDNPVLLDNYELLDEFDILFEPAPRKEKKL